MASSFEKFINQPQPVPASQTAQPRRWQRLILSVRLSLLSLGLALATCLTGTLQAAETTPIRFPADAGLVDVTTYGAKGDGKTDDTAAITKAIGDHVGHSATIYFPPGTYLVSDRLDWRSKEGTARCWLAFQGAGPEHSIIRLKDATFTDPKNPKGVVRTNSEFQEWNGDKPEQNQIGYGNKAFFNSLRDLTIDVGVGNPGAIGIEYMANNRGTLRNLVIRSSDPQGAGDCGIDMRRYGPGPALCVDVVIEGFAIGMDLAHWEYGMTFNNLTLRHQTQVGIRNNNHSLAIENLVYEGSAGVYQALEKNGLLTVLNATITGKGSATDKPAFNNQGGLYLRNATATGFRCLVRHNEQDVPGLSAKLYTSSQPVVRGNGPANGLQLLIKPSPRLAYPPLAQWVNVRAQKRAGDKDDTDALRRACASGKSALYFPRGSYSISNTVVIPAHVTHIVGLESSLNPAANGVFDDLTCPRAALRFEGKTDKPVIVDGLNLAFEKASAGFAVEHASQRPLALRHLTVGAGRGPYRGMPGSGELFMDDVITSGFELQPGGYCWARQLNSEFFSDPLIQNHGGHLWILQMKTEGQLIALGTDAGGRTELVGGLFYPLGNCPDKPLFVANNADFSATYAVSGYTYNEQVAITNGGEKSSITNKDVPGRGAGANVPLLVVANAERLAKPIAQPNFEPLTPEAWVALHPVPVEDIPVPAPAPVDAPTVATNQLLSGLGEHGKVSLASGSAQLVFLMDRREVPFFMREVVATLDQSWKGPKGTGGEIRPQNGNNLLDFASMGYRNNHSYDCTAPALAYYPNAAQTVKLSGRLSFFCENKNENDAVSWWVFRIRPPLRVQVIASGAQGHDTSLDLSTVPELQAITLEANDQLVISGFRHRHNHWANVHMADVLITPLKPE